MQNGNYFASMNTGDGFRSYYGEVYGKAERVYVIKGGPGTGKSTLMKRLARKAENAGEEVERYYCSSDVNSLDGIILKKRGYAVVDGTPPHIFEPRYPGVRDVTVDLGKNWDIDKLRKNEREAVELTDGKKKGFSALYKTLSTLKKLEDEMTEISGRALDCDKILSYASRFFRGENKRGRGKIQTRVVSGYTSSGVVSFDTFEKNSDEVFNVTDRFGAAKRFLSLIAEHCERNGIDAVVSPYWLDPSKITSLYIPERRVTFVAGGVYAQNAINIDRFIKREELKSHRSYLRFLKKCSASCMEAADAEFASISVLHGRLEEIYSSAMDFSKNEAVFEELSSDVFSF